MQERDENLLKQICAVDEIPDNIKKIYREFQRVQHRYKNGQLNEIILQVIAVLGGFGAESKEDELRKLDYDWESVPSGADVRIYQGNSLNGGRGNIYSGTFITVLRGDDFGMLEIAVDGESEATSKVDHRIVKLSPSIGSPVLDEPVPEPETVPDPVDEDVPEELDFSGDPEPAEKPAEIVNWESVEIGTQVVVAESEGGNILFGKLHRVPSAKGKHAGKLYINIEGDDRKYCIFNNEEVTVGITQQANA